MRPGQIFKPTSNEAEARILSVDHNKDEIVVCWYKDADGVARSDAVCDYRLSVFENMVMTDEAELLDPDTQEPNEAFRWKRWNQSEQK